VTEKFKVLVVDDELPVCKSIASALTSEEYLIDTALSGEEALELQEKKQYDAIIIDLMMPGISGMELLKRVKKNRPDTMMIMITIRTAVESIKIGAFDYIPKPFTPNEIRSIVSRALTRKRVTQKKAEESRFLEDMPVPEGLYTIPENSWAKVEDDGSVLVGVHHMLLVTIQKIAAIEFPKVDETRYQGETCVRIIESNDHIHKLWTPVTGKVTAINTKVQDDYSLLYKDPYVKGWLVQMTPTNLDGDLKNLLVT
jgi:CheY-like chemotaxis protein/glycine cleavage system H lipoate-binding protein